MTPATPDIPADISARSRVWLNGDMSADIARALRDGCGCPPPTMRCAHWEDVVLWLVDLRSTPLHGHSRVDYNYTVLHGQAVPCNCEHRHLVIPGGAGNRFDTDDPGVAQAEFTKREAQLLGHGDG